MHNSDKENTLTKSNLIKKIFSNLFYSFKNQTNSNAKKNPESYILNFPEYTKFSKEELADIYERDKIQDKFFRDKYGEEYERIVKKIVIDTDNEVTNDTLDIPIFHESIITDRKSFDDVMKKLDSGEITEDDLSVIDLFKINEMLKYEVDLQTEKLNLNN